ncbi:MAG: glycine--tRNA ligase subunit beta [Cocleimonas sp.]|nr:glycine--tRNA ligase subunit beta [Cocleimonas sp.]
MSNTKDLLIEIGTEELPPKALQTLSNAFTAGVVAGLKEASLEASEVISYAAPRRLAILLKDVPTKQADQSVERKGPAKAAAFDADGNPTKAVEGFARSCGVAPQELEEIETPKGTWLIFKQDVAGKNTSDLLPEIVSQSLAKLPIPKRMRWGASDIEFVRPVHWIVMMQGNEVIEGNILGIASSNTTKGHRFHHPDTITIKQASSYAEQLRETGHVIANFKERRDEVQKQAEAAAKKLGGIAQLDSALLDEVTGLIELPIAVSGSFGEEFLDIPQECLISSMQDHQKYFPVVDKDGKLLPYFITTSNIKSKNPDAVRQGNERVIRPRFADAKFFWDQDCKVTLESHRESTKKIIFQKDLGTLFEKTERVADLAGFIAEKLNTNKTESKKNQIVKQAKRAARLSKCDLMSEMVKEFPELQGIMGRYYASNDEEASGIVAAMQEQYEPKFAGDTIPTSELGKILSLADKIDTLVGIFAVGMKPTGSKDPFALRRASLGLLRILIEGKLNIDLEELFWESSKILPQSSDLGNNINWKYSYKYTMDRLRSYYLDQGLTNEVINTVTELKYSEEIQKRVTTLPNMTSPLDFDKRVHAVAKFKSLPEAESLAAANKRISNILKKSGGQPFIRDVDKLLLKEPAEITLYEAVTAQQVKLAPLFESGDYSSALTSLASLRDDVDAFFDGVMVMADDEKLRNNRLALLNQLRNLFLNIADLSRL